MRDVAKVVKRRLNESTVNLISKEDAERIIKDEKQGYSHFPHKKDDWRQDRLKMSSTRLKNHRFSVLGDRLIKIAINFIKTEVPNAYNELYIPFAPKKYIITDEIDTAAYDEYKNYMFLNYNFIEKLNESELAFVILHQCAYNKALDNGWISLDKNQRDDVNDDRDANFYIERQYPYFKGYSEILNSII